MKSPTRSLLAVLVAAAIAGTADAAELENTLYMDLKDGRVVIEMRPDLAPKHVTQIKRLTRKGFYDGLVFHRVIEGFMVQGGDPDGNGTGGSGDYIPAEFSDEQHLRGVMSMARSRSPDSADSQFFIMLAHSPHLDGAYTIWGKVTNGMKYVDNIKKGDSRRNGSVDDPDKIVRMRVAADVK